MDEQAIVKTSILSVFNENGYTDPARMTQRDFDHIGEEIEKKSGILISGTTIKRLANGEFSRLPQIATLNAIANYFNYKTWQDYKTATVKVEPVQEPPQKAGRKKYPVRYLYILGALVIVASFYFFSSTKGTVRNAGKASFSFRKSTSNDIPNTVIFSYNIDAVQGDSFFIQQSWDENRRVRIYKNKYTITDIYYEPGYHVAKLIANDSIIRTMDISIPTDRWFFYAIDPVPRYTTQYIKTDSFISNGSLRLTVADLQKNRIDFNQDKRYHYVYFPTEMNVSSENFQFTTRVRVQEAKSNFCPYLELELYCQREFMIMKSTTKGCAHEALLCFGEQLLKGHENDLLPIAYDVSQWTDIAITVKNKMATIKINDKEVFSTQYKADTKLLTGLGFISNGLIEVDKVSLTGLDGRVLYKNEF